jgi:hypothetical protein
MRKSASESYIIQAKTISKSFHHNVIDALRAAVFSTQHDLGWRGYALFYHRSLIHMIAAKLLPTFPSRECGKCLTGIDLTCGIIGALAADDGSNVDGAPDHGIATPLEPKICTRPFNRHFLSQAVTTRLLQITTGALKETRGPVP